MAERTNQTPESTAPTNADAARLMSRRKFTRAGLATPIVLSALASKPVLGQVARNCTKSGQVSGNLSSPGDESCFGLGLSPQEWLGEQGNWPIPLEKLFADAFDGAGAFEYVCAGSSDSTESSTATSDTATSPRRWRGRRRGRSDSDVSTSETNSGDAGATGTTTSSMCVVKALAPNAQLTSDETGVTSRTSATLLHVLGLSPPAPDSLEELGRQVAAAYLNAHQFPTKFPVRVPEVVAMFKQVWQGGSYTINSTTSWTRLQVVSYLKMVNGDLPG